ncbi:MAG: 2-dehydropantoate 2-reductase [Spirochaetales bacterium]|nr:2-dehydropantoate 2-reductase [Spirochaetales bacterium]
MSVLIYGGGAVGLGLASCLIKAGKKVTILARPETVKMLSNAGLSRSGIFGDFTASPENFTSVPNLNQIQNTNFNFILLCTKSFDTKKAAQDLSESGMVTGNTCIVLCQNGWGNARIMEAYFDRERIYNARIITGFTRLHPNHVKITVHADAIHIGSLYKNNLEKIGVLSDAIERGGIPSRLFPDIEKDLWAKMLYNCALNPLGAIFKVAYGTLAEYSQTRTIMESIIKEIFLVMNTHGYKTHWPNADEYLKAFYNQLVPPTSKHESSMLQDIRNGKKTEIDGLNGQVLALAVDKNMASPCNEMMVNMIKFLEKYGQKT